MLHNIRLGHACNSSSTHSIVPAERLHGGSGSGPDGYGWYGWSWFELKREEDKMRYLAALLNGQLEPSVIAEITGHTPHEDEYVDHQSSRTMPSVYREEFARDLADWLRRPEIGIRGGNDNEDAPYEVPAFDFPLKTEGPAPLARPDFTPSGERFWSLYYPRSGDKVRFTFQGIRLHRAESWEPSEVESDPIPYGSLPELVDLKLTAFCPFEKDCPWCYMDSTRKGAHATKKSVAAVLRACREAGVFEIAVGGGEPTMWPHLDWLTQEAQKAGVTLNMTTKNFSWLRATANRETLCRLGAIAVSVNNERDLQRFKTLWGKGGPDGAGYLSGQHYSWQEQEQVEVTVQCIPALLSDELTRQIIDICAESRLRVTFLGLKRTGRAEENTEAEDLRWIEPLAKRDGWWLRCSVAVDTIMAAQAKPRFEAAEIDPVFYGTEEGAFSCYVDAVEGKLGPSSYCPADQMLPFRPGHHPTDDDLGSVFRASQVLAGLRPKDGASA